MGTIAIAANTTEELTSEDYDMLYDFLMQLGFENIKIETR